MQPAGAVWKYSVLVLVVSPQNQSDREAGGGGRRGDPAGGAAPESGPAEGRAGPRDQVSDLAVRVHAAPRDPVRLTDGRTETPEKPALAPRCRGCRKANGALLPLRGALTSGASFLALLGSAFSQQAGQNEEAFRTAHLAPDTALGTHERTRVPRAECRLPHIAAEPND